MLTQIILMETVMGFQFRRRTKGKSGWLNFSYSEKNGLGMTGSIKAGPVTYNTGNSKRGSRATVDLGNGIKHVSYGKTPKSSTSSSSDPTAGIIIILVVIWISVVSAISLVEYLVKLIF